MPPKRGAKKAATTIAPKSNAKATKAAVSRAKYDVKKKGKVVSGKINDINDEDVEESDVVVPETKTTKAKGKVAQKASAIAKETTEKSFVNEEAIKKAISELIKFDSNKDDKEAKKAQLFDDDISDLYLQITNVKFFSKKQTFKAKKIDVPHSVYDLQEDSDFQICLFVKDDVIDEELLEKIEASSIPHLAKVISAKELKGEYHSYEARRKLASTYDLFLSDDALITTLPKLLGKIFYTHSNKTPVPIKTKASSPNETAETATKFSITTVKNQITKVLNQVAFVPPMGVNISLKIGNLNQELNTLLENAKVVVEYFNSEPYNIRIIQLKLKDSPSLPIYINEDNLYNEEDVASATKDTAAQGEPTVRLSAFEKGLVELALDEEQINSVIGKKVKRVADLKKKIAKKNNSKVTKPTKKRK